MPTYVVLISRCSSPGNGFGNAALCVGGRVVLLVDAEDRGTMTLRPGIRKRNDETCAATGETASVDKHESLKKTIGCACAFDGADKPASYAAATKSR